MKKIMIPLFTVLLLGCLTKPQLTTSLDPVVIHAADMTISLKYVTEDQVISLYGKETNIFTNYPGLFPKKRSLVFKMDISSVSTSAEIEINDISLSIGDVSGQSRSRKQLLNDWKFYIKENNQIIKAKKMVNEEMFEDTISIIPGQPQSAWIVFLETYPEEGDTMLTINMTTADGESGAIEIPLDFTTIKE